MRTLLLSLLFIPGLAFAAFKDTADSPYQSSIHMLADDGVVEGYVDGTYRPLANINRAEFIKIVLRAMGEIPKPDEAANCFKDFTGAPAWYWWYACRARELKLISGYPDGSFRGERNINQAEALKIIVNADAIPLPQYIRTPDNWYDPYFDAVTGTGLFNSIPYGPSRLLTRGEMAELIVTLEAVVELLPVLPLPVLPPVAAAVCGNKILEIGEQCDDGNVLDNDGCSKICIIVPEPVRHAAVRIDQRPVSVSGLVPGARNITLLAFDALAGRQDAILTYLKFKSLAGNLNSATNFQIYFDDDNNGTAETRAGSVSAQSGKVAFSTLQIPLPEGSPVRVELRADITENISTGQFSVGFDTSDPRFIQGMDREDGRDITGITINGEDCAGPSICWISVYPLAGPSFSVDQVGNLFITADNVPVSGHQLLAGTLSPDLLTLKIRAESEEIEVSDLNVTGAVDTIDHLVLYKQGVSQSVATGYRSQCADLNNNRICFKSDLVIPADTEQRFSIRAWLKAKSEGGVSGQTASIRLTAANIAAEAYGLDSQHELAQNDGDGVLEGEIIIGASSGSPGQDILAPASTTVFAKVIAISNGSNEPDGTAVPAGTATIGRFRFGAAVNVNSNGGLNAATLRTLVFSVSSPNVALTAGSFRLANMADPGVQVVCSETGTTGAFTVTCPNLHQSGVSTRIESGQSLVLGLYATVANPQVQAGSSTLQVSLQSLGNPNSPGTIIWDDGINVFDWVDTEETSVRSTAYRS